ncbi:MAG TPA: DUF4184 family protein [Clostridia bacterium]|nr:DUF4184 family protein [Clostridia bacterium]
MPFTPCHLGPSSCAGLLFLRVLDLPTLIVGSVIPDFEPFCVLAFGASRPLHGFWHTFLGGSVLAVFVAAASYSLRGRIRKLTAFFGLAQDSPFAKMLLSSVFGACSHVLLDSSIYGYMRPLYPLDGNPFFGLLSRREVCLISNLSFAIGIPLYLVYLLRRCRTDSTKGGNQTYRTMAGTFCPVGRQREVSVDLTPEERVGAGFPGTRRGRRTASSGSKGTMRLKR